jgi:hypothetical protein
VDDKYVFPVIIKQVNNGYIVDKFYSQYERSMQVPDEPVTQVFQTFTELMSFLSSHFTHRNILVCEDTE